MTTDLYGPFAVICAFVLGMIVAFLIAIYVSYRQERRHANRISTSSHRHDFYDHRP